MSAEYHVAAVDLGATSGRVMRAVVTPDLVDMVEVARFPNGPVRRDGALHWDIDALRSHIMAGLRAALAEDPHITSIGIDSWAVDYGLVANGRLLGAPFHYRDERNLAAVDAVHAVIPPAELYATTGLQHLPFNTLFQLTAEGARLGEAEHMLLIPDLVAWWLTGRPVAEATNASTTGLLDPRTQQWHEPLIERLGLPRGIFAEVVHPGETIGALTPQAAAELGVPADSGVVVTAVGSHDTASAVAAVPFESPSAAYISCGTWGLVGLELEHPVMTDEAREANITNEGGVDGRVRFLHNVTGLWLLSESMRSWEAVEGPIDLPQLLGEAGRVTGPVPIFDANDPRLSAPGDMPRRIAEVIAESGQPVPTTHASFARSIVESLAAAFAATVETIARIADRPVEVIHVVGGGSLNALLCQLTADRSGLPVLAGPVEATALGNVLVQARALGLGGELEALRKRVARSHPPVRYAPRD